MSDPDSPLLQSLRSSVLQFLSRDVDNHSPEQRESLEVAIQCLSAAYSIDLTQKPEFSSMVGDRTLETIYERGIETIKSEPSTNDPDYESKLANYIEILKNKGYFRGLEEGSDEYQQRYNQAADKFKEFISKKTPSSPQLSAAERAEALKEEGNRLFRSGGKGIIDQVIKKYTEAIELYPTAIYYSNRASAYSHMGKFQESIQDCEAAIKLDPTYSKSYLRLGGTYRILKKYEESLEAYSKGLAVDPNNKALKEGHAEAKEEQEKAATATPAAATDPSTAGSLPQNQPDMASLLGNLANSPMFQQMAQSPGFSNLAQQFAGGMDLGEQTQQPPAAAATADGAQSEQALPAFNPTDPNFMNMAQNMMSNPQMQQMASDPNIMQMASNFVSENPELVNQMLSMFGGAAVNDGTQPDGSS